jgi:Ser/Thr protein kinase RdoA (MazF antagonist)
VPDAIATIHGDFYDDQVLLGDAGPTLLDLDEIRRGHPLLDIGNMAAHLAVGAESDRPLARTGDTFVRAAVAEAGIWSERDVIPFEAAGLLRLAPAPFRNLESDWVDRVERIVTLAETRLAAFDSWRFSGGAATPVDDPALPQLASLLNPGRMNTVLARADLGTLRGEESIHMVRHKPGRRAIIRYDVASRTGTTETLFGKTFSSERGPRVYRVISTIAAAQALGAEVAVPEPVAFDPELKLLLQRATPGRPVVERIRTGDTSSTEAIAEAINHLHGSGLDLGRRHDLDREFAPLPGRVADVGSHAPHLRIAAEHCLRDLLTRRDVAAKWRWQPVHRDFYHDQVLIDGDRLAILDLDDAAMSEPAVDIANFAAHLRLLGIQERDDPAAFAPARRAFMTRAAALDPGLDESLLCLLEAATLVRLAGIHVSRDNGARVAQRLLVESHALLAGLPLDGRGTVLQRELTG